MNRRWMGIILSGIMAISMVGCQNKIEKSEEKVKYEISNFVERNIEEYSDDDLPNSYRIDLEVAKAIDNSKSSVDIKELDDVYEVVLDLRYKEDTKYKNDTDKYIIHIDKDIDLDDFNIVDMYYKKGFSIIANISTFPDENGTFSNLYCIKGYEGYKESTTSDDKYDVVDVVEEEFLKYCLYSGLGYLKSEDDYFEYQYGINVKDIGK